MSTPWSHEVYEVIDAKAHKYSATAVSGGGTNAAGGVNGISSTVTHYSDQELWVRNLDTDKERKFDFRTFNIDARPGHKLMIVRHQPSGRMERIINNTTGDTYAAGGIYNTWGSSNQFIRSFPIQLLNAIFITVMSLLPFLGWVVVGLGTLAGVFTGSLLAGERLKSGLTRFYNLFMVLCIVSHAWFSLLYWGMFGRGGLSHLQAEWVHWLATLLYYFTLPGYWAVQALQAAVDLGDWWTLNIVLLVYGVIATTLINGHHGRRIRALSRQVDDYSAQQIATHSALN